MSTSSRQDAQRERVVSYGSDDFDRVVRDLEAALEDEQGMVFFFTGASQEEKQDALAKVSGDELNLHRFNVPSLLGDRLVETQGNLREAFDHADEGAAVLFFDEADVLFDPSYDEEADEDDAALSDYFFDRVGNYPGVAVVCFSSPQHARRPDEHRADVIVEF